VLLGTKEEEEKGLVVAKTTVFQGWWILAYWGQIDALILAMPIVNW